MEDHRSRGHVDTALTAAAATALPAAWPSPAALVRVLVFPKIRQDEKQLE